MKEGVEGSMGMGVGNMGKGSMQMGMRNMEEEV